MQPKVIAGYSPGVRASRGLALFHEKKEKGMPAPRTLARAAAAGCRRDARADAARVARSRALLSRVYRSAGLFRFGAATRSRNWAVLRRGDRRRVFGRPGLEISRDETGLRYQFKAAAAIAAWRVVRRPGKAAGAFLHRAGTVPALFFQKGGGGGALKSGGQIRIRGRHREAVAFAHGFREPITLTPRSRSPAIRQSLTRNCWKSSRRTQRNSAGTA